MSGTPIIRSSGSQAMLLSTRSTLALMWMTFLILGEQTARPNLGVLQRQCLQPRDLCISDFGGHSLYRTAMQNRLRGGEHRRHCNGRLLQRYSR